MIKRYAGLIIMILLISAGAGLMFFGYEAREGSENTSDQEAPYEDMPQDGKDYIVVGFSQIGAESDWRNASTESFRSVFTTENGDYLLYEDAQQKQENQLKAVRNFILQEVDYIVLDPIVETGWDTVLQEAKDANIPVILVDRQLEADSDLYTCWVGSDFKEEGRLAGKWLEDYLKRQGRAKEKIRIVTLQGTPRSSAQLGRTEGFQEVLSSHKKWKMLDCQSGEFTQAKGQEVMEGFLQKYKDIDVVISENDNMTFGAVEAIETAGRTCGPKGDIIIISFDAVRTALQYMQEGRIHADFECNPMLGPFVSNIIRRLEAGEEVEKVEYVQEQYFDSSMNLSRILGERKY